LSAASCPAPYRSPLLDLKIMLKERSHDLITPVWPPQAYREAYPASYLIILPHFVLQSLTNARHLQARFL